MGVSGRAFVRVGLAGPFSEIGPSGTGSVAAVAVATVGETSSPLVVYLTTSGQAYARYGAAGWLHEMSSAKSIAVAAGHDQHAFPIFAVEQSDGTWLAKDGTLSSGYKSEGATPHLGLGALIVS